MGVLHARHAAACAALLFMLMGCDAFTIPTGFAVGLRTSIRIRATALSSLSAKAQPAGDEPDLLAGSRGDAGRRDLLRLIGGGALYHALPSEARAAEGSTRGTVLVVGATGAIGQTVCQQLLGEGYAVRALTRRTNLSDREGREDAGWTGQVKWVVGDLTKPQSLRGLFKGVDKVVWCAGSQAYLKGIELNRLIYAESVGIVAKLAKEEAKDLSAVVLVSSNAVTRFNDPDFGGSDYLKDVLKWKAQGEKLLRESGVPYSVLRFSAYYGGEANPDKVWITQGDPPGRTPMSLANLALIVSKCLSDPKYGYKTFETAEAREGRNPGGNWEEAMDKLVDDPKPVGL
mmetsp:Transcript_45638/g.111112  ORF Transcript_45638/g.111112 Transcript_45638/m.111112 type:complete len:344 (-) Transcript_45638:91-1122(-)